MSYASDILNDFAQVPPSPDQLQDPNILYEELLSIHNAIERLAGAVQELVQYNIDNP